MSNESGERAVEVIENVFIPMSDGCRLAARIWRPVDAGRSPVPAILEYIPYRKRDFMRLRDEPMHHYYARHGYASVRVDLRGSGDSSGVLEDEYLPLEQDDAVEVIEWLARQPWCTGKVGMTGISWGGFSALQAAERAPAPLAAVIALCASDDRYADDAHYMGGCLLNENQVWGTVLFALNALPPDPEVVGASWRSEWLRRLEADRPFPAVWLSHPRRDAYWRQGSVCEHPERIRCPVYAVGGWADGYSNAVPRLLSQLHSPRKGLIGPWAHTFPQNGMPGPAIGFLQEALRWWDRWLKSQDNGIEREPSLRVWMQDAVAPGPTMTHRPGRWVAEDAWPAAHVAARRLWLDAGGSLRERVPRAPGRFVVSSPPSTGIAGAVWCEFGADGEAPLDQRLDDGRSLVFETEPLSEPLEILGAVELMLTVECDQPHALLAARINDVAPGGESLRVTLGLLNLCHRDGSELPQPLQPGKRHRIRLCCNDAAHRFARGHRIRLSLSTSYWPVAWPSRRPAVVTVHGGASMLTLPVRAPQPRDRDLREFEPPLASDVVSRVTELAPPRLQRSIERDLTRDEVIYRHRSVGGDLESAAAVRIEDIDLVLSHTTDREFRVRDVDPLSARTTVSERLGLRRGSWRIRVEACTVTTADAESFRVEATLRAWEGERDVFSRCWDESLPRDLL
jgi:putative CocE/NonD family hydrolase